MDPFKFQIITTEKRGTILRKASFGCLSGIPTINITKGCLLGCVYCYARGYKIAPEKGKVYLFANIPNLLEKYFNSPRKKSLPSLVIFNTASDCFQPHPDILNTTYITMEILLKKGVQIAFLTKGIITERFFRLFSKYSSYVMPSITINSLDKEYVAKYEPNTASPLERIKNLKELINIGIKPGVRIDPIIPFVNDSEESFERLLSKISEIGIKEVTASSIHIRPSIENILKKELSDIHKELLFSYFKTQNWRKIANGPFEKLVPLPLRKKIYERLKVIADKKGIHVKICQCKNPDLKGDKCFSLKSKNRVSYGQLPLFLC